MTFTPGFKLINRNIIIKRNRSNDLLIIISILLQKYFKILNYNVLNYKILKIKNKLKYK